MTHKRSRRGKQKRQRRTQNYHNLKEIKRKERYQVWLQAFYDEELDEVVNRLTCLWNPIHQGEVLTDSRNRGFFQRIN